MVPKSENSKNSENYLKRNLKNEFFVPLVALQKKQLTILESLIVYLHDNRKLNYHEIAVLLKRDEANVRHSFQEAKLKLISKKESLEEKFSNLFVPASIFADRKISAFEALVLYLKENSELSLQEISVILNRSSSTVRVIYSRARKKYVK